MELNLLVIRCSDIKSSKAFYETLGLTFVSEKHGTGPDHYSSETLGFVFELYPLKKGETLDNTRLGFKLANPDIVCSKLDVISSYKFYGEVIHIVQDPDGRKIEISKDA